MINHYGCGSGSKIKSWIISLRKKKQIFNVIYLEYFDSDGPHVDESEIKWIKFYKDQGVTLLNHDIGGRSNYLKFKYEENRKIQSALYKELFNTPEMKNKFSELTKKQWQNPEIRQKMLDARQGITFTEEQKNNMSKGQVKSKGVKIQDDLGNIFNSMKEAAEYYNVNKSTIQRALYSNTHLLGDRKLTRIGGGAKPVDQLKPMNSYYKTKTNKRWKKKLSRGNKYA